MHIDDSEMDVNQAADPSAAATAEPGVSAPAGVTAAPGPLDGVTPTAQDDEPARVPYSRFSEKVQAERALKQQLEQARKAQADHERQINEYKAKVAKYESEPFEMMRSLIPKPPEPTFDDPFEEKAYRLEKALEERDKRIEELQARQKAFEERFEGHTKSLEERAQLEHFSRQLETELSGIVKRDPMAAQYSNALYQLVGEGRARNLTDAWVLFRHENIQVQPAAKVAAAVSAAPANAPVAPAAPRPGPPPVRVTPTNLGPARPAPKSLDDVSDALVADLKAGRLSRAV